MESFLADGAGELSKLPGAAENEPDFTASVRTLSGESDRLVVGEVLSAVTTAG